MGRGGGGGVVRLYCCSGWCGQCVDAVGGRIGDGDLLTWQSSMLTPVAATFTSLVSITTITLMSIIAGNSQRSCMTARLRLRSELLTHDVSQRRCRNRGLGSPRCDWRRRVRRVRKDQTTSLSRTPPSRKIKGSTYSTVTGSSLSSKWRWLDIL